MSVKDWENIVAKFPTMPYLFVGSGLSRRYLGLPDWKGLLGHFAMLLSNDPFKIAALVREADGDLARVGSMLQKEFDRRWFDDKAFRKTYEHFGPAVSEGKSAFKEAVAEYLAGFKTFDPKYEAEVSLLKKLSSRNISGIITTNYDTLFEQITGFQVYRGQEELLFSEPQMIGELYKIHGCVTKPESIVLTSADYEYFDAKCAYLAAKLMTIFVEYPVIFLGYSLTDPDVMKILSVIIDCMPGRLLEKFSQRLIFVQRDEGMKDDIAVGTYQSYLNGRVFSAVSLRTDRFDLVYRPLEKIVSGFPVKILRRYKDELYKYTLSQSVSKHILVQPYDPRVPGDSLVLALGIEAAGEDDMAAVGIQSDQWYKAVVRDEPLPLSADVLLSQTYPNLKRSTNTLPVFKFLSLAENDYSDEIKEVNRYLVFDDLISRTARKARENRRPGLHLSVKIVIEKYQNDARTLLRNLEYLKEQEFNVEDLGAFLNNFLDAHPNYLTEAKSSDQSLLRKVIRIYDWLKYHDKLEL